MMHIIIIGAGKIGASIAFLLKNSARFDVTVADISADNFDELEKLSIPAKVLDVNNSTALESILQDADMVLNAGPYFINIAVAKAAAKTNTHYFDLSEDVATTTALKALSKDAGTSFMPQCGLAPGYISITGNYLASRFDRLKDMKLRVGALPVYPTSTLKYNLTWSTDGLINEYCNPCDAIVNGDRVKVQPLEGYERFALDGIEYEAFNTSGGLGALAEVLEDRVENLDYKTVRYPGHKAILYTLLYDLGFHKNREPLKKAFEENLAFTRQDLVIAFTAASGWIGGKLEQYVISRKIYNQEVAGKHFTAIQLTTASAACAVIDLHAKKELPQRGFIRQEEVGYDAFINNPFAACYR